MMQIQALRLLMIAAAVLGCFVSPALAQPGYEDGESFVSLAEMVDRRDYDALRELGPGVMPDLAALYSRRDDDAEGRQRIAGAFYQLGWKSPEAVEALLPDVEGDGVPVGLRISAQYALGRVSNDNLVVRTLLRNMRSGRTPLERDKAACALAHDQIHLEERQKVLLFRGLVASLDDPKIDVRRIAALALKIHTGQTKGYRANAPREKRLEVMETWHRWIRTYAEQL